jgi:hypothetical protein
VSGGGYLGASLSSLLVNSKPETLGPRRFPLRKELGETEPPALRNLRNGSNYLKPPGLLNAMGLPAIVLLFPFAMVLLRSRMTLKNRHRYLSWMAAMLLGTLLLLMGCDGAASSSSPWMVRRIPAFSSAAS